MKDWCFSSTSDVSHGNAKEEKVQKSILDQFGCSFNSLILCQQVHGIQVACVTDLEQRVYGSTDGLVTDVPGIVLGIFTADCLPIFLADPVQKKIGILHAGWKGLKGRILNRGLEVLGARDSSQVQVKVGPHICSCCYEVQEDVTQSFSENTVLRREDRTYLDLQGFVIQEMVQLGVRRENVVRNEVCTSCSGRYFSYRRDRTQQRMLSLTTIKG